MQSFHNPGIRPRSEGGQEQDEGADEAAEELHCILTLRRA
jgi:hypothetical protein